MEVEKTIYKLNPGILPAPDGLSAAFYKTFKCELYGLLADVFNESYELDGLSRSFSEANTIIAIAIIWTVSAGFCRRRHAPYMYKYEYLYESPKEK